MTDTMPAGRRADDWKSYVALDGAHVIVSANAPTTCAEQLERRGLHRAQIVQNAAGTESYLVAELLDEAWQMADFAARYELVPKVAELQARLDAVLAICAETSPIGTPIAEIPSAGQIQDRVRAALMAGAR